MTTREIEEYRALRDTIRERGTARHWIVIVGLATWCALAVALSVLVTTPVTTLLPLLLLASTFEVVFGVLCRRGTRSQFFTDVSWGFEGDVASRFAAVGLDARRVFSTPVAGVLDGSGDYVITAHTAAEIAALVPKLSLIDVSEDEGLAEVLMFFYAAASESRGLALFLQG